MEISIIIFSGITGALLTFYLNNSLQLGGVMASAGVSVLAGGLFHLFPDISTGYLSNNIPLVVMGCSFIGMASSRIIKKYWVIAVSGLFFSTIYLLTGSYFEGFGGSLGTTAAISLCTTFAINQSIKKLK
ncbi:hypothetical protein [Christiangramia sp. SM2212]|uniref:Uncharacterized protein n=1 Tax=Christiangramia sediminicola TaxID=3073267 RepID=A0ABU1EQT5_9FLAO|nr:hypothetical protein [Christiangramia sp. SM2212]MDR5590528.1 hypothetical protein [Christiangramia sp. SM2212]